MSRPVLIILAVAVVVLIVLFATGFFSVKQTQEAQLPNVSVTGGQAPKYDVDSKKVVVGTTPTTVEVPKVETEKKTINVPVVGVTNGSDDHK